MHIPKVIAQDFSLTMKHTASTHAQDCYSTNCTVGSGQMDIPLKQKIRCTANMTNHLMVAGSGCKTIWRQQ
jgi:hypothetical protein